MAKIEFNIEDAKLDRVKAGMLAIYPNTETAVDPNWVNPQDGTTAPQIPKYTDNQWLKERIRRFVVDSVKRAEQKAAQVVAKEALEESDSIIS